MEIYNTTWWGNAIDTAITAGTEPDFFGSQMKMLTSQQPELVTNGDFATDSAWGKGGWVIENGQASNSASGVGQNLYQQGVTSVGNPFKVVIDTVISAGSVFVMLGGGTGGYNVIGEATTSGTFTYYGVSNGTNNNILLQTGSGTTIGSVAVDNVSVKLARAEEVEAVKCLADWIHTTALQDLNN